VGSGWRVAVLVACIESIAGRRCDLVGSFGRDDSVW
jgi:hypothetical protein